MEDVAVVAALVEPASEAVVSDSVAAPLVYSEEFVSGLRTEAAAKEAALSEKLVAAEARARAVELAAVRSRAAAAHSLPAELHEFVTADDEAGALGQAAKLAASLKPAPGLPRSGGRAPANASAGAGKLDDFQRLEALSRRVPSLNNRVLRG